jgi:hypothetical protein
MKFIVLTKSAKRMHNDEYGYCVAGLDEQGGWVRLVSDEDGDSLPVLDCGYFECLDVIDIEATPCPIKYQPENMKLEQINGIVGRYTIERLVERFGVSAEKYCFVNNKSVLSENERRLAKTSLMLVKVSQFKVYKNDKDKYKAQFIYNDVTYTNFSITDNRSKRLKEYEEAYIVVSLPSVTNGYFGYFKFIAAIYPSC